MIEDILGRLKNLRLNIINSPDFNTYATNKSKNIIDQVLQTFIRVNNKNIGSSGLDISTSSKVFNSFSLNGNHLIKNKIYIINQKNNIITMIKITPEISSDLKRWAITKINMIK